MIVGIFFIKCKYSNHLEAQKKLCAPLLINRSINIGKDNTDFLKKNLIVGYSYWICIKFMCLYISLQTPTAEL